jgi:hypothetical protein
MLAAFRTLPLLWRILTIGAALGVILGAVAGLYAYVDHQGYQRATLEWTLKYERREAELRQQLADELDRQTSINAMAKAAEEAELEALRLRLVEMSNRAMVLMQEAAADPHASNVALDAAAVDRYNRRIK